MINRLVSITTILVSVFCSVGFAQEADTSTIDTPLTFKEAVKIALENNVTLNQRRNQQYVNQARKSSNMARIAPSVTGFAQGWKVQGNQFIEQEGRVVNDAQSTNFYGSLDARMMLFNGLNRVKSIQQSNEQLHAQEYFVQRTKQDVIRDVSNQYLQCLLDEELLKIAEENLKYQQTLLTQLEEQVKAGSRADVDRVTQEAQTKNAELSVIRARFTLRNDKATLAQTLLLDPVAIYELAEPGWTIADIKIDGYSPQESYQLALQNRGDLLQSQHSERAAKYGITINRSAFMPSLNLYGSVNSRFSDASVPSFSDQMDGNLRREYGLQLNIPIFNGLQNRVSYVSAKVDYENAKLTTEANKNTVKSDVLRAYQNYEDAIISYEAAKTSLEAGELSFQLEDERYRLGAADMVQHILATQNYFGAQSSFAQAKYTLMFQEILIKHSLGTLNLEDIP